MTAPSVRAPVPAHRVTLRTLALVEARRYARHPLFLFGAGMVVVTSVTALRGDWDASNVDSVAIPAFFLGLLGVFVGYRLTRSVDRSADAVEAAPADGVTRTAALCLACLLPGAVALAWLAWMHLAMALWPVPATSGYSSWDRIAMLGVGVVGAVGGPLVGVLVARWARFPAAGLIAAVVLVGWCLLGTFGLAMPASWTANLVHLNPPFATWLSADGPDLPWWVAGGSPSWYVAYLVALCGLAATAAMLHEAVGRQRRRLLRVLAVIGVVAVTCLTLAATADPTRVPL